MRRHFYIHTPFFLHFQIWPFWPQEPKNSNLTNSFLAHYPQPKMNQKSPKDPKLIFILTIKLLYTYEDAAYRCFDLAHTDLAHLSPNRATHLKSPEKRFSLDAWAPTKLYFWSDPGFVCGVAQHTTNELNGRKLRGSTKEGGSSFGLFSKLRQRKCGRPKYCFFLFENWPEHWHRKQEVQRREPWWSRRGRGGG